MPRAGGLSDHLCSRLLLRGVRGPGVLRPAQRSPRVTAPAPAPPRPAGPFNGAGSGAATRSGRTPAPMSAPRASNDRPPGAGGVKRGRLQQEAAASGARVTVVLGAQWGDEGKGKVVDLLATDADIVSRCQVRLGAPGTPPTSPRDPGVCLGVFPEHPPTPWAMSYER